MDKWILVPSLSQIIPNKTTPIENSLSKLSKTWYKEEGELHLLFLISRNKRLVKFDSTFYRIFVA